MSIELLQTFSLISYICAGVALFVAAILFFVLDIKKVCGDITGSTARKAIDDIRRQNESTGNKAYKPSSVNIARGKTTDKITSSGRLIHKQNTPFRALPTEKIRTSELANSAKETTLLSTADETTVLNNTNSGTTLLASDSAYSQTTVLGNRVGTSRADDQFAVDIELGFTSSPELIE